MLALVMSVSLDTPTLQMYELILARHHLCRCPQILIVAAVVDFGIALVNGESGAK